MSRVPISLVSAGGCIGARGSRGWGCVLHGRAGDGSHMGSMGLGRMVDMGCASNYDARSVAHLCELLTQEALCGRTTDADISCGA